MRSVLSVEVAAPPDLVFDLVCDVSRWADLLPHYVSIRRLQVAPEQQSRAPASAVLARYVAVRPLVRPFGLGIPVAWRSLSWSDPDRRHLRFRHVGGVTGGMDVVWTIESIETGSRVSIEHVLRRKLPIPMVGDLIGADLLPRVIDVLVIRPIAGRTLATVRALAGALAESGTAQWT